MFPFLRISRVSGDSWSHFLARPSCKPHGNLPSSVRRIDCRPHHLEISRADTCLTRFVPLTHRADAYILAEPQGLLPLLRFRDSDFCSLSVSPRRTASFHLRTTSAAPFVLGFP